MRPNQKHHGCVGRQPLQAPLLQSLAKERVT